MSSQINKIALLERQARRIRHSFGLSDHHARLIATLAFGGVGE